MSHHASQGVHAATVATSTVTAPTRYPAVVDAVTVRLVAGTVLLVASVAVLSRQWWLFAILAADFVPRTLYGPKLSFIAQAILVWVRPRVAAPPQPTSGAPKRFAAGIGAVLTSAAALLALLHVIRPSSQIEVVLYAIGLVMVVFPALEALLGFCVGCTIYGLLIRAGVVTADVCVDCAPSHHASTPAAATETKVHS